MHLEFKTFKTLKILFKSPERDTVSLKKIDIFGYPLMLLPSEPLHP